MEAPLACGLYEVTSKHAIAKLRADYSQPIFTETDLIKYDLSKESHRLKVYEELSALQKPRYLKGLDKMGRMVLFLNDQRGTMIIFHNTRFLTCIFDSEATYRKLEKFIPD